MNGWLSGIFSWLASVLEPWLRGLWDLIKRQTWFFVALILGILSPISWAIDWWAGAANFLVTQTASMLAAVQTVGPSKSTGFWSLLQGGAALMNCVVALDYGLAVGTMVMSLGIMVAVARGFVWVWKLIPFKAS